MSSNIVEGDMTEKKSGVMAQCLRCKKQMKVNLPRIVTTVNGRRMLKGKCVECDTNMSKFVKKDFKLMRKGRKRVIKKAEPKRRKKRVFKSAVVKDPQFLE